MADTRKKSKATKQPANTRKVAPPVVSDPDIVYVNGVGNSRENGRSGPDSKSASLRMIQAMAQMGNTQSDMSLMLGMNKSTFTEMKKNNPSVAEAIARGRAEGRASLRRRQHEVAMGGDTRMLIFLGKNRLKQSERILAHTEQSQGDSLYQMMRDAVEDDEDK